MPQQGTKYRRLSSKATQPINSISLNIFHMTFRSLLLGAALLSQTAAPAQSDLDRINTIRRTCDDINATHWTDRRVAELDDSWIDAFYRGAELRKISVRTFDEAGSSVAEYYLHDGALVYVYEQATHYDESPADSTSMEAALEPLPDAALPPRRVSHRSFFDGDVLFRRYSSAGPLDPEARLAEGRRLLQRLATLRAAVEKD